MMDNASELFVYKASAGSGKTFTLAVEYIKLLIANPTAYRNILAVTFTNKATTEMKERILGQLFGIAIGDTASDAYLNVVSNGLGLSPEEVRDKARRALSLLIHDYSRFRVETIDSFFQSVMRNLARELELGANMNIALNNAEVLSDAVDILIEKLDRRSPVLGWLLEFIRERIASDKRWNVSGEIKSFGLNIFDETYIEKGDGLRAKLADPQTIPAYRKLLEALRDEATDVMHSIADQFFGILEAEGLRPDDLAGKSRGIASYFKKLRDGKWGDDIRNSTVEKCLDSADNWAAKTSPRRSEIIALASAQLQPLLVEAEKQRPEQGRTLNSCELSLRYLNQLRLLANIDEEVRALNRRENRFLLSDTNALLRRLMQEGDSSFVFEKIGTTLRHVMIDEFQDTSRMQWNNFKMLLLEGLSQGAGSLIVGDVKQSIYRWRNGDWSILNNLRGKMEGIYPIREMKLTTNRRSESNIIRFNNDIFTAGSAWLNEIYRDTYGTDCTELQQAYSDVCQDSPRKEEKGYVHVDFLIPEDNEDYVEMTLECLAEQVEKLVSEGVRLEDITILVRKNKNIPVIADYFSANLPYRIVSDEAFRLDASSCVCALIDCLRWLADETDTIALARLAAMYQREIVGSDTDWNTLLLQGAEHYVPQDFITRREELRLMPLYELLEHLFTLFGMAGREDQDAYLFAFFDAVIEYLQENSSDLDSFLAWWDDKLCAKTIPSGELEGIRIYSIHKSKGLEFHTVLIPFCDWSLENEIRTQMIWCTPQDSPYNELDLVPVNYGANMANSTYEQDYRRERVQLWVDNLNLLYVAFTRAGKNLFVWAKDGQSNSISTLLYHSLCRIDPAFEGMGEFETGTLCPSVEKEERQAGSNRLTAQPDTRLVKMASFDNRIDFRQSNRSADFIRGEEDEDDSQRYIRQGRLLHYVFATIRTRDDVEPTLAQMESEGLFDSAGDVGHARSLIQRALARPEARKWFDGSCELFNECSIVYMTDGELQTRRPDRVMIDGGQVVVVDFKFGKQSPAYHEQVRGYMQLLRQMGYTDVRGYLWYIYKNELITVE